MPYKRNPADVAAGIDASKTTYDPETGRESTVTTDTGTTYDVSYDTGSACYSDPNVVMTPEGGVSTAFPESYSQTQQQELIKQDLVQKNILQVWFMGGFNHYTMATSILF